jgi:hypothetical protein
VSEPGASFFERLELELRDAAERPVRRRPRAATVAAALAVVALLAVAVVPALVVLGGGGEKRVSAPPPDDAARPAPVGTVVQRGGERHLVVATGTAPVAGRWQMETYRSVRLADPDTGEEYQPAGLRCLGLAVFDAGLSPATSVASVGSSRGPRASAASSTRDLACGGRDR